MDVDSKDEARINENLTSRHHYIVCLGENAANPDADDRRCRGYLRASVRNSVSQILILLSQEYLRLGVPYQDILLPVHDRKVHGTIDSHDAHAGDAGNLGGESHIR